MAAVKKVKFFIECGTGADDGVTLRLSNALTPIIADIGYTVVADDLLAPAGKSLIGDTKEEALENGCLPIVAVYLKGKKRQSARILVSPKKADTVFKGLIGKTYGGGKIVRVLPVRKRAYTM